MTDDRSATGERSSNVGVRGGGHVTGPGARAISLVLVVLVVLVCFALYALWAFWPTGTALKDGSKTVHFLSMSRSVSAEHLIFVVVAAAGVLGGLMHSMRSFAWYSGNGFLKWRWLPYFALMPVVGGATATVVYLVIRGGFFGGSASSQDVNPYSFAAVGALVGLFTEEALEMLKKIATQVFSEAPQGADSIPAQGGASAAQSILTPTSASIAADGASTQVLTVQAKDATGNNLLSGGSVVGIALQSGTGTVGTASDNGDGTYSATVTAPTEPGSGVFVATMDGAAVCAGAASQATATVTYTASDGSVGSMGANAQATDASAGTGGGTDASDGGAATTDTSAGAATTDASTGNTTTDTSAGESSPQAGATTDASTGADTTPDASAGADVSSDAAPGDPPAPTEVAPDPARGVEGSADPAAPAATRPEASAASAAAPKTSHGPGRGRAQADTADAKPLQDRPDKDDVDKNPARGGLR